MDFFYKILAPKLAVQLPMPTNLVAFRSFSVDGAWGDDHATNCQRGHRRRKALHAVSYRRSLRLSAGNTHPLHQHSRSHVASNWRVRASNKGGSLDLVGRLVSAMPSSSNSCFGSPKPVGKTSAGFPEGGRAINRVTRCQLPATRQARHLRL